MARKRSKGRWAPRGGRSKPSNLAIAMALIVVLLLALGAYTNLFGIVQPRSSFTTWPKIIGVYVDRAYTWRWAFGIPQELRVAALGYYYKPITWDEDAKKWVELPPPSSTTIVYFVDLGTPIPVFVPTEVKPGYWKYEEAGYYSSWSGSKFRLDPDDPASGLPDIAIYVKPLVDKSHPNGKLRWASYEVHIGYIAQGDRERPVFYKNSYADILFDPYYQIVAIRLNGEELTPGEDYTRDKSGRVKIQLLLPSKMPEQGSGVVTEFAYVFNLNKDKESWCDSSYRLDIIYDPNVVVATAKETLTWVPTHPTPTTTTTGRGGTPAPWTVTTTVTKLMKVTTTRTVPTFVEITVTDGRVVTKTLTHTIVITGYETTEVTKTITEKTTITKVVTKKVGGGVDECLLYHPWNQTQCLIPRCLIKDKEGKCVLPAIYAIIGAFLAIYLGTIAGFSIAARKGRRSRRRR